MTREQFFLSLKWREGRPQLTWKMSAFLVRWCAKIKRMNCMLLVTAILLVACVMTVVNIILGSL